MTKNNFKEVKMTPYGLISSKLLNRKRLSIDMMQVRKSYEISPKHEFNLDIKKKKVLKHNNFMSTQNSWNPYNTESFK